jgi:hypothetical protein
MLRTRLLRTSSLMSSSSILNGYTLEILSLIGDLVFSIIFNYEDPHNTTVDTILPRLDIKTLYMISSDVIQV